MRVTASLHCRPSAAADRKVYISPQIRRAAGRTMPIHSHRGLPTWRMYRSVAGRSVPGVNETALRGLSVAARTTFPSRRSWRVSRSFEAAVHSACSRTDAFDSLDSNDGFTPRMSRRHLHWNPSNRRSSAFVKHAAAKPYRSRDSTRDS